MGHAAGLQGGTRGVAASIAQGCSLGCVDVCGLRGCRLSSTCPCALARMKSMPVLKVPPAEYAAWPSVSRPGLMLSEETATSACRIAAHGQREAAENSPRSAPALHMRYGLGSRSQMTCPV